jgi:hypothetical protein
MAGGSCQSLPPCQVIVPLSVFDITTSRLLQTGATAPFTKHLLCVIYHLLCQDKDCDQADLGSDSNSDL